MLNKTKKQLFPYASKPDLGCFRTIIESKHKLVPNSVYVVDHAQAGNLLGIKSSNALGFVQMSKKIFSIATKHLQDTTFKLTENVPNEIKTLIERYNNIFEGHGKLKNYYATLHINTEVQPVYQKLRREPYHLRKAINDKKRVWKTRKL